jgi:hypothetical protein
MPNYLDEAMKRKEMYLRKTALPNPKTVGKVLTTPIGDLPAAVWKALRPMFVAGKAAVGAKANAGKSALGATRLAGQVNKARAGGKNMASNFRQTYGLVRSGVRPLTDHFGMPGVFRHSIPDDAAAILASLDKNTSPGVKAAVAVGLLGNIGAATYLAVEDGDPGGYEASTDEERKVAREIISKARAAKTPDKTQTTTKTPAAASGNSPKEPEDDGNLIGGIDDTITAAGAGGIAGAGAGYALGKSQGWDPVTSSIVGGVGTAAASAALASWMKNRNKA